LPELLIGNRHPLRVAEHRNEPMRALPTLTATVLLVLVPNHLTLAKRSLVNTALSSGGSAANKLAVASSRMNGALISPAMEIASVAFCEMVKNPKLYFDKTVRVTATIQMGIEGSYLHDDKCVLGHDDRIGLRYLNTNDQERAQLNCDIRKIGTIEYGGRARVTVIGILRNSSLRAFASYRYRFDVSRVEGISPVIVPYEGTLEGGKTYQASVRGDSDSGLSFAVPLRRINEHFAVGIEWTNLTEFPALAGLRSSSPEQQIVFTVVSDQSKQMTERRWNRTVGCKIISLAGE
jgi:hypothetical protein